MKCEAVTQIGYCVTAYCLHENPEVNKATNRKMYYSDSNVIVAALSITGSPDFDL